MAQSAIVCTDRESVVIARAPIQIQPMAYIIRSVPIHGCADGWMEQ